MKQWFEEFFGKQDSVPRVSLTDMTTFTTICSTIIGGSGDDSLSGGSGDDYIVGLKGNDVLEGEDGNDEMKGGAGNDYATGGAGRDLIFGGAGDDLLVGNKGNDTLKGGDGADVLNGGSGHNVLVGGEGADSFLFHKTDLPAHNVVRDFSSDDTNFFFGFNEAAVAWVTGTDKHGLYVDLEYENVLIAHFYGSAISTIESQTVFL